MAKTVYIIADNESLVRLGWIFFIQQKMQAISVISENKTELANALRENEESSVIIDIDLFDWKNRSELFLFAKRFYKAKWLFVARVIERQVVYELVEEIPGANIILKTAGEEELFTALNATATGKKYYCSEALDIILGNKPRQPKRNKENDLLTSTELQIIALLAQGKSTKEIAAERCLSPHTVITHRKNIFRKLEVNTVHELTKYALKNGFVDFTEYYI